MPRDVADGHSNFLLTCQDGGSEIIEESLNHYSSNCVRTVPKPYPLRRLGLASERKADSPSCSKHKERAITNGACGNDASPLGAGGRLPEADSKGIELRQPAKLRGPEESRNSENTGPSRFPLRCGTAIHETVRLPRGLISRDRWPPPCDNSTLPSSRGQLHIPTECSTRPPPPSSRPIRTVCRLQASAISFPLIVSYQGAQVWIGDGPAEFMATNRR